MSDAQFTPEPWTVARSKFQQDGEYDFAVVAGGKVIAEAFGRVGEGESGKRPAEANAHLIAAAPDLLAVAKKLDEAEALHANCEDCEEEGNLSNLCANCFPLFENARLLRRAAIAKAEGGSK